MLDPADFILSNTTICNPPHVPEIRLHLADEAHDLWLKTEGELQQIGLPPPFWAFAWAGGQGLARYLLDNPEIVRGRRVLDFATGSGLVAVAACLAGASNVLASDIDSFCRHAVALNAALNDMALEFTDTNFLEGAVIADVKVDVLLAGDVFYDQTMAEHVLKLLDFSRKLGMEVLVGDPGRSYFPDVGFEHVATYQVPVTRVLEDSEVKQTRIWRYTGPNVS